MIIDTGDESGGWGSAGRAFNASVRELQMQGYGPVRSRFRPMGSRRKILSQHGTYGAAADFGIQEREWPAFARAALARGMVPIPEFTRAQALAHGSLDWSGPHAHVQAYPAGRTPGPLYAGPMRVQISEDR